MKTTYNTKPVLALMPHFVALSIAAAASPLTAQTVDNRQDCGPYQGQIDANCDHANAGTIVNRRIQPNVDPVVEQNLAGYGFSISVDDPSVIGQRRTIAGARAAQVLERAQDQQLHAWPVQVTYDRLGATPRLNLDIAGQSASFRRGDAVTFVTASNYPAWIHRAEIELTDSQGLKTIVPTNINGNTRWRVPAAKPDRYKFILRVYDAQGRYDETVPQYLSIVDEQGLGQNDDFTTGLVDLVDHTAKRSIPVHGAMVVVSAKSLPQGTQVRALGTQGVLDQTGDVVIDRILPPGAHNVFVHFTDPQGRHAHINRNLDIPRYDSFGTGVLDLTVGRNFADKDTYAKGRVAGFVTGVTADGTRFTASIDTGEDDLSELFHGLDRKNPKYVLDQVKSTDVYVTMGDDSTVTLQAPTSGKLYVHAEKDNSFATVGDFKPEQDVNRLVKSDRDLFGVQAQIGSDQETADGQARVRVAGFASQPDTVLQRDILRDTGGRTYTLSRRDILAGSQTVAVQIIDPNSGRVIQELTLKEGTDYAINPFQGIITLTDPLMRASAYDDRHITDSALGDPIVNLAVSYEYAPVTTIADTLSYGLRGEAWVNDNLRIGASVQKQRDGVASLDSRGIDIFARADERTWINIDIAESKGQGADRATSLNGGLEIDPTTPSNGHGNYARAVDITGELDLARIGSAGTASAYYQTREAGFVSADYDTALGQTSYGAKVALNRSETTDLHLSYDRFFDDAGQQVDTLRGGLSHTLNDQDHIDVEISAVDHVTPGSTAVDSNGRRVNVGVKYTHSYNDSDQIWIMGQGTVSATGTMSHQNRLTLGGQVALGERSSVSGQVSTDRSAEVIWTRRPDDSTTYTMGYRLDPSQSTAANGANRGTVVVGATSQVSEKWYYSVENTYSAFSKKPTFGTNYGVTFTPSETWQHSAQLILSETRSTVDQTSIKRTGLSWGTTYAQGDAERAGLRLEYAQDRSSNTDTANDRHSYAVSAYWDRRVSSDWRWLANLDAMVSQSDQSSFRNGEFAELTLGYAYRPVDHDRTNALISVTALHDLPGADQVNRDGNINGAKQQSIIMNVSISHELSDTFTIGGKYGYRLRKMAERDSDIFTKSRTHLGIIRLDYHVVHNWDIMGELRMNRFVDTQTSQYGANLGVYRHFGNNLKAGLGYTWGKVSDDLRTVEGSREGIYFNIIAKF